MEKKDLLTRTHSLLREATPHCHDVLLLAGIYGIKGNLLNYYRDDLDYPAHSARAIVKMTRCMLRYFSAWNYEELTEAWPAYTSIKALYDMWRLETRR